MNDRFLKVRFALSAVLLITVLAGLASRLAFLHLGDHKKASRKVEKTILGNRGAIYDRVGRSNILALNLDVKDVCVDPKRIIAAGSVKEIASELAIHLDDSADEIERKIRKRPSSRYARIQKYVQEEDYLPVRNKELEGVFLRDSTVRYYPLKSMMCHVLGFVNYVGTGCSGVEQGLDGYLKGSPGLLESSVNAKRQELSWRRDRYIPALEGADLFLCLDQNIQHIVETELDRVMKEHNASAAWAIVEHVKTGEIMAMASRPSFDLNEFGKAENEARLNRPIGAVYEPGSTFKAAVIASAIDKGAVSSDSIIDCENGSWNYKGRILTDGSHSYGRLTVSDIIKKSSNIGAAKVALSLGDEQLEKCLRDFGVGSRLGIDLPGEENGILHPVKKWSGISGSQIAFGQGVALTALQMLGVFCAIANDGVLMKPHVTRSICREDGTEIVRTEPRVLSRPISPGTATIMKKMLLKVTEDGGTGVRARVKGYHVAGKTGTAQKAVKGGYSKTDWIASFVGFLPADNPQIAIIVVVDEPQPQHAGGRVAAPAFSRIAEQTIRYLEVTPESYRSLAQR